MVLRIDGWRVFASVALCVAAAGVMSAASAMDFGDPGLPPGEIPMAVGSGAQLMWGGPVPPAPRPGEVPVYVPSESAYSARPQPQPQYATPPAETYAEPEPAYQPAPAREPWESETASLPDPGLAAEPDPFPEEDAAGEQDFSAPMEDEAEVDTGRLYVPRVEGGELEERLPPIDGEGSLPPIDGERALPRIDSDEALPPLAAPVEIDGGMSGYAVPSSVDPSPVDPLPVDPWEGLTAVTPGAVPPPPLIEAPRPRSAAPILEGRVGKGRAGKKQVGRTKPSYASLEARVPPKRKSDGGGIGSWFGRGRGALEKETPTGYRTMPQSEAICRRQLQKLGVKFVDAASIAPSRSCGIDHPVKIHDIAPGVAMRPAATLNCQAALRVAKWMKDEVKPAARWKMLKSPTVLINASSYRCSRIAGSRSISEHASGSALDVRGFKFSDGSIMEIEKKGFFSFREKGFQKSVRESACRHFGTVLGPGYNEDHADHLHLDTKQRRRAVCK